MPTQIIRPEHIKFQDTKIYQVLQILMHIVLLVVTLDTIIAFTYYAKFILSSLCIYSVTKHFNFVFALLDAREFINYIMYDLCPNFFNLYNNSMLHNMKLNLSLITHEIQALTPDASFDRTRLQLTQQTLDYIWSNSIKVKVYDATIGQEIQLTKLKENYASATFLTSGTFHNIFNTFQALMILTVRNGYKTMPAFQQKIMLDYIRTIESSTTQPHHDMLQHLKTSIFTFMLNIQHNRGLLNKIFNHTQVIKEIEILQTFIKQYMIF